MSAIPLLMFLAGAAQAGVCEDLSAAVEREQLEASLEALTGEAAIDGEDGPVFLRSRHVAHPHHDLAQAWLLEEFAALGLTAALQPFEVAGLPPVANIVGSRPGEAAPVCVTAHFDSTGHASEGWDAALDDAPGADDDASGVAAVLEAARILAGWAPGFEHALHFIAFDAEEQGLHGSWHHAETLDEQGVEVVLNLDPVGFNAGGAGNVWVTFDANSEDEATALQDAGERLETLLSIAALDAELIGGDARSDHYPFWVEGWPALHIASFPQPPEYHTPGDRLELVDVEFLHAVTRVVVLRACEAAVPQEPPAEPPEGAACADCGGRIAGSSGGVLLAVLVAGRRRRGE